MLNLLASGDLETFKYFADQDYSMVKHLIGYGIVRTSGDIYDFQIDSVKDFLVRKHEGRFDAHATIPDDDEITLINAAIRTIEKGVEKFNDSFL